MKPPTDKELLDFIQSEGVCVTAYWDGEGSFQFRVENDVLQVGGGDIRVALARLMEETDERR